MNGQEEDCDFGDASNCGSKDFWREPAPAVGGSLTPRTING